MNKFVVIGAVLALAGCTQPHTSDSRPVEMSETNAKKDSLAILENFKRQEACWNAQDLECYVEAYHKSDNVQTISRAGITRGYDAILGDYQTYFPEDRMGRLHFDALELKRLSDQYYYVTGRFNLTYEVPDTTIHGWFSVLMEKKNDKWLMISDHSS